MLYDDEFILGLPPELEEAVVAVLQIVIRKADRTPTDVLEARDLIVALYGSRELEVPGLSRIDTRGDQIFQQLQALYSVALSSMVAKKSDSQQSRFMALVSNGFSYKLSEADVERIQNLVNELRTLVTNTDQLEKDHRQRLLEKLEKLQIELHRKMSSVDRFYGLIGDAGVMLGKFGKDAKPFVDRIREIVEIIWRSQANAEQLPASAKPALLTTDAEPENPGQ